MTTSAGLASSHTSLDQRLAALHALAAGASLDERVAVVSRQLLRTPYLLDPAGEGPGAPIDQDPLVNLQAFDCQTYVETVLAIARTVEPHDILAELLAIRYRDSVVSFEHRLHFPELDWIPVNVARGVIRDVSAAVAGQHSLAHITSRITRRAWLRALPGNPTQARNDYLRGSREAAQEIERIAAAAPEVETVDLQFIPKAALMDQALLDRIPNGAIVFIVRPMTSMFGNVGSRLSISHLGFAVRTPAGLMYRHASSQRGRAVIDRLMSDYLAAMGTSRSFGGIAVYALESGHKSRDRAG
ncbi:MAG TPA: DUF1460 domain-containing protein [Steroidobacteraceae bacterium]|nr:DUF1460 domain-containing protein [Steroidobacteraceae bacterium]HRX90739.1 DUF1460 domain-containing protein [Steroidobacteraceae bacterium]